VRTTRDLPRLLVEKPTALADNRNAKDLQDFFAVAAAAATATAAVIIIVAAATSAIASIAAAAATATVTVAVAAECEDISDPHTDPSL
jgi:hypothetical protein